MSKKPSVSLYPNNFESRFLTASAFPQNRHPRSRLARGQWSLVPDDNFEEPPCQIPNFRSHLGILLSLFVFFFTSLSAYNYSILREEEFYARSDELATLRINVFREYPYLYDGSLEYEKDYLSQYLSTTNSALVVVKDGERIIGAITGIPLNETFSDCKNFFVENNIPMEGVFYLGEITLLKEYRGQGIGARMYELFEEFVRENKIYKEIALCEVVSPKDDPRCTSDYFCLDSFWARRGYIKNPDWVTQFSWKELNSQEEFYHPMVFWSKKL